MSLMGNPHCSPITHPLRPLSVSVPPALFYSKISPLEWNDLDSIPYTSLFPLHCNTALSPPSPGTQELHFSYHTQDGASIISSSSSSSSPVPDPSYTTAMGTNE